MFKNVYFCTSYRKTNTSYRNTDAVPSILKPDPSSVQKNRYRVFSCTPKPVSESFFFLVVANFICGGFVLNVTCHNVCSSLYSLRVHTRIRMATRMLAHMDSNMSNMNCHLLHTSHMRTYKHATHAHAHTHTRTHIHTQTHTRTTHTHTHTESPTHTYVLIFAIH